MATAEKQVRRIVQPSKPNEPTSCLVSLPTHIQESKKLIKRNGETVEIVTLTLTSSPNIVQEVSEGGNNNAAAEDDQEEQKKGIAPAIITPHQELCATPVSKSSLLITNKIVCNSTNPDDDSTTGDHTTADNILLDRSIISQKLDTDHQQQAAATADDYLIVTSTSSDLSSNNTHEKITFITTDASSTAVDDMADISSHTDHHRLVVDGGETAGTSGMASQNMSLVQMVDTSDLTVQNSTVVTAPSVPGVSSVNLDDYSFCLICGDKGSGFHYSVFSCEGCKGFFKRSVQKNLTYTCKNDGNCEINRFSRNNCQYCRFKKCLQFGMKKEGVRDDRTPGGLTRARFKRMRMPEHDMPATESKQSQYQLESDIQLLVNCDPYISPSFVTTEEKTATLYGAFQLTAILYDDLIYIVKWAKQVLGFKTLEIEDQKRLLESSFVELSLFRLAYRSFASEEGKLRFAHDIELTLSESQQLGFDPAYIDAILTLIDRLKDLDIDDKEYAILCSIMLFYEDTVGLRDTITVLKMQQKYLTILQRYIRLVYGGDLKRYGRMLLRLPGLRTIAMEIDEVFEEFIVSDRPSISHMLDSALLDPIDTDIQTYDQMVITSVPDIQLDEAAVITSADVETVAVDDADIVTESIVDHVSIETV